jgi:hypothetical protein
VNVRKGWLSNMATLRADERQSKRGGRSSREG